MSKAIKTIEDLQPDPNNANRGTPRGHSIIEQSVRQRGAGRSGLAAADGTMIAGSQTLQKMAELGIPVKTVHTNGSEWVVVVRDDIEAGSEAATLLALEDNRATEVGLSWEPDILAGIAADMDLSGLFYPNELANLAQPSGPVDPAELWRGMPEFEQEDKLGWKTISVHFENEQDYHAFARLVDQTLTPQTKYIWYPYQAPLDALAHRVEDES